MYRARHVFFCQDKRKCGAHSWHRTGASPTPGASSHQHRPHLNARTGNRLAATVKHSQCQSPGTKAALPCRSCRKRLPKLWTQIPRPIGTKFSPHRECHIARSDQKRLFPGLPFSSLPPVEASCSLSASPDHEDFHPCQMGTLLTVGQIGKPFSSFRCRKLGPHLCLPSGPLAGVPPLLLTVAALRFPGTSCPPIAPLPRIALAPSATGGASGDSSKSARLLCLRQHFPAFHITRWKTLCIMWKTSRYVILWKSCENFAHPLCTAKVL